MVVVFKTNSFQIQLGNDLTSSSLRRFVSPRTNPVKMYWDNDSTFMSMKVEIDNFNNIMQSNNFSIQNHLANEGIDWNSIPVQCSYFDGF